MHPRFSRRFSKLPVLEKAIMYSLTSPEEALSYKQLPLPVAHHAVITVLSCRVPYCCEEIADGIFLSKRRRISLEPLLSLFRQLHIALVEDGEQHVVTQTQSHICAVNVNVSGNSRASVSAPPHQPSATCTWSSMVLLFIPALYDIARSDHVLSVPNTHLLCSCDRSLH